MSKVRIFTTPICPYCKRAKSLLAKKHVAYEEIDVYNEPTLRDAMTKQSGGARTVPQIFIGDLHVGGCDDLFALDAAGKLDPLLAQ